MGPRAVSRIFLDNSKYGHGHLYHGFTTVFVAEQGTTVEKYSASLLFSFSCCCLVFSFFMSVVLSMHVSLGNWCSLKLT